MFFQESNNVFRRLNYNYSVEIRWIMYGNKMTLPAIRCNKSRREIESRRRIVVEFLIAFTVNTLEKCFPFQSSYELYYLVWYVSGKIIIIPRIKFECDILSKIRIVHTIKNIFQNNHRGCIKRKQKRNQSIDLTIRKIIFRQWQSVMDIELFFFERNWCVSVGWKLYHCYLSLNFDCAPVIVCKSVEIAKVLNQNNHAMCTANAKRNVFSCRILKLRSCPPSNVIYIS